jgi:hypothetical protein
MKKDQSSDKGKGKKKKKYKKPSFTKHGKLGRMVVAMSACCVTARMRRAVRNGSRRQMSSLLRDLALAR